MYYRLRQVDFNGLASYSPVRPVTLEAPKPGTLQLYPSLVGPTRTVYYKLPQVPAAEVTLPVLDLQGRTVLHRLLPATTEGEVKLTGLGPGTFLLRFICQDRPVTGRCVLQ